MEQAHYRLIRDRFGERYTAKITVLDVPDNFICWEAGLVQLLKPRWGEGPYPLARHPSHLDPINSLKSPYRWLLERRDRCTR